MRYLVKSEVSMIRTLSSVCASAALAQLPAGPPPMMRVSMSVSAGDMRFLFAYNGELLCVEVWQVNHKRMFGT